MEDLGGSNHGGIVYGFITTGHTWRVLSYDGASFLSEVSDEDKAMATTFWHLSIVELGWHNYTLRIQR